MRRAKLFVLGILTFGLAVLAEPLGLAHGAGRGEAKATIGRAKVSIDYGRPIRNDRDLLKLIQPGKLWRIGADAPTTIESDADLDFGGMRVPKGKHILLARFIEPGKWSLVVSSKDALHYEPSAKIAEVPMQLEQGKDPADEMTIGLSNESGRGVITIAWGSLRLLGSFAPAR